VPYWVDLPWEKELPIEERKGMLMVPYNYDCNDGKFHMAPGFMSAAGQTYESYLKVFPTFQTYSLVLTSCRVHLICSTEKAGK
jgi:hypothetical protein